MKTPLEKLSTNIEKLLDKYAEDVNKDVNQLAKDFGKKGAQAVRDSARAKGWGEHTGYDKGWTSTYEEGRLSSKAVIHNKDVPGLAHLLENGHAMRNGGRVAGRPHIAPVEEKITEEFVKAVKHDLQTGL